VVEAPPPHVQIALRAIWTLSSSTRGEDAKTERVVSCDDTVRATACGILALVARTHRAGYAEVEWVAVVDIALPATGDKWMVGSWPRGPG
jgi:hypothetical protein